MYEEEYVLRNSEMGDYMNFMVVKIFTENVIMRIREDVRWKNKTWMWAITNGYDPRDSIRDKRAKLLFRHPRRYHLMEVILEGCEKKKINSILACHDLQRTSFMKIVVAFQNTRKSPALPANCRRHANIPRDRNKRRRYQGRVVQNRSDFTDERALERVNNSDVRAHLRIPTHKLSRLNTKNTKICARLAGKIGEFVGYLTDGNFKNNSMLDKQLYGLISGVKKGPDNSAKIYAHQPRLG